MTYSSLLSTFLGAGLFVDLPVPATITASIPPGWVATYFATDTGNFYCIANGESTWTEIAGGGSGITVSDGTHTETGVTDVVFSGATVSSGGSGIADVSISGGGGGGSSLLGISNSETASSSFSMTSDTALPNMSVTFTLGSTQNILFDWSFTCVRGSGGVIRITPYIDGTPYTPISGYQHYETMGNENGVGFSTAGIVTNLASGTHTIELFGVDAVSVSTTILWNRFLRVSSLV